MAHLRAHSNSRFWYVRFRDLDTGDWREESTHLLRDDPQQTRQAQRIAEKKNLAELQLGQRRTGAFREWVADFITHHYKSESTRRRTLFAWERLSEWLKMQGIRHPREIRFSHTRDYIRWREPNASRNTALYELHVLAFLLNEAVRREHAERNVLAKLGIGRTPPKVKPELTFEQITAARAALVSRPEWMSTVFEIQLYTGCRVSEASFPLTDIDFASSNLTLTDAKRSTSDPRKRFEVPLDPALRSTLERLTGDRTAPVLTRDMVSRYNKVLMVATGTTSHSLRVTFVTSCHRAGLNQMEAMRLVNHSTRLVHLIYSRLNAEDVRSARSRVSAVLPPAPQFQEKTEPT